jgi:hypothetical protein
MRGPHVDERERGVAYRFGEERRWAMGRLLFWAETFPPGPFSYFSFLCFFSFSIFLISFTDFAKMLQINLNYFQKFCRNSQQGFKSIGNKFSETNQEF